MLLPLFPRRPILLACLLLAACGGGGDEPAPPSVEAARPVDGALVLDGDQLRFTPCDGAPGPLADGTPDAALTGLVRYLAGTSRADEFQARIALAAAPAPAGDEGEATAEPAPPTAVALYRLKPGTAACAPWPAGQSWRVHGIERGWTAQVTEAGIDFRDVNQALTEHTPAGPPDTSQGDWRWTAPGLSLTITTKPCLDPLRGYFAHSAVLTRGETSHSACAEAR